jgi:hypothetical protein
MTRACPLARRRRSPPTLPVCEGRTSTLVDDHLLSLIERNITLFRVVMVPAHRALLVPCARVYTDKENGPREESNR